MKTAKPADLEARDCALAEAAKEQAGAETAMQESAGLRAEERTLRQKGDPDAAGGKAKASPLMVTLAKRPDAARILVTSSRCRITEPSGSASDA